MDWNERLKNRNSKKESLESDKKKTKEERDELLSKLEDELASLFEKGNHREIARVLVKLSPMSIDSMLEEDGEGEVSDE